MTYGKSIKLDSSNDFAFNKNTNSFSITTEDQNLQQALKILLSTIKGELCLYTDFGVNYPALLLARVSDDDISHAITSAVIRDPRVKTVDEVTITRSGRTLQLGVSVTTTKNATLEINEDVVW